MLCLGRVFVMKYTRKLISLFSVLVVFIFALHIQGYAAESIETAPRVSEESRCEHVFDRDGVCLNCGYYCEHEVWTEEGECEICGYICSHAWKNGICQVCGYVCPHVRHDRETGNCLICKTKVIHDYNDGVCDCGAVPDFTASGLTDDVFAGSRYRGTIESCSYDVYYPQYDVTLEKHMNVYLPFGYNKVEQYNILFLINGAGGDEHDWTDKWHYVDYLGYSARMQDIYDYMIANKVIRPLIIVAPQPKFYMEVEGATATDQFAEELRDYILPLICSKYSTYAASSDLEDIRAERDHFGIGGISNGALYALDSGMQLNLDLFSNFIAISGNNQPNHVSAAINNEEWIGLPISCLYAGAGALDGQLGNVLNGFDVLVTSTDRLKTGANAYCVTIYGAGHDYATWTSSIYNALQVVF